ncbi:MAG: helix-hairpin-helix domain-containing protein [Ghiorsea sp.]
MMRKILVMLMMLAAMFVAVESYAGDMLNINMANVEELQMIKGVGPKTAASIVAYREAHGDFSSVAGLTAVKGIGDKKLA